MNRWAYSIDGKLRTKGRGILGKGICLSATLFTKGMSLESNPELYGDRTRSSCNSHATVCHMIFGSICIELFSHTNVAVLFHKS
jgi:hypothetical protein